MPRFTVLNPMLACYMLFCVGVIGCAAKPAPSPSFDDLPEDYQPFTALANDELHRPGTMLVEWVVYSYDLPLGEPTDAAWALTRTPFAEPRVAQAWRDNGMRAGVLAAADVPRFTRALPALLSEGRANFRTAGDWVALVDRPSPPRGSGLAVALPGIDTPGPDGRPASSVPLVVGRLRLQTQASPRGAGLWVQLVPQRHEPPRLDVVPGGDEVRPLSPAEREEAGWWIDALRGTAELGANEALVIGLHRPWPAIPTRPPGPEAWPTAIAAAGLVAGADYVLHYPELERLFVKVRPPAMPQSLGRYWFTADRAGQPVQRLLIITRG